MHVFHYAAPEDTLNFRADEGVVFEERVDCSTQCFIVELKKDEIEFPSTLNEGTEDLHLTTLNVEFDYVCLWE